MTQPRFHPLVRLLIFIAGSVALTFLVSLVIGWAVAYSARVTPGMPPPDLNAPGIGLVFTSLIYPPLLIWTWFCRHVFDRRNYVSLGLGITRAGRNFLAGGALGALAMALIFGVLLLCGGARINGFSPEAISQTAPFITKMLLFYSALYFAVGYFEETIFRGYLLQNFSALIGKSGGVAAQAILFALIHLGNPVETTPFTKFFAMLNIALVGWLLALCYRKSGSLWYPIGFHVAWNFFQGCVFSLPVSGSASFHLLDISLTKDTLLSGGAFGPEAGVLPTLMLLALILLAQRLPDHTRAATEIEALQRGEDLHPEAEKVASETVAPLYPEEADADAPRDYSPPRYRSSLSAAPRRATAIDWSDVNTRGGAAALSVFTPGVAPSAEPNNAATNAAITSAYDENTPVVSEENLATSPVEFTPQSAPRGVGSDASTRALSTSDIAIERDESAQNDDAMQPEAARASRNIIGEAPLPAGARVTASRSNFGAAPRDDTARIPAAEANKTDEKTAPAETRKIATAPPLPNALRDSAAITTDDATDETPRLLPAPPVFQQPEDDASTRAPQDEIESLPRILSTAPESEKATSPTAPPASKEPNETKRAKPRW